VHWQPKGEEAFKENFPADASHMTDELIANLVLPDCEKCGGMLKPDVVFFGENVDRIQAFALHDVASNWNCHWLYLIKAKQGLMKSQL